MKQLGFFRRPSRSEVVRSLNELVDSLPKISGDRTVKEREFEEGLDHLRRYDKGNTFRSYRRWYTEYKEGR